MSDSQGLHTKFVVASMSATPGEIDLHLLKAMHIATELLGMLRRFYRDPRQCCQIRADIVAVAHWITLLIARRKELKDTKRRPDLIQVCVGVICNNCDGIHARHRNGTADTREARDRPSWSNQLAFLFACTQRVTNEVFQQDGIYPGAFPDCLAKLWRALLLQRRYLSSMGGGVPRIEVLDLGSDYCDECGTPINPAPEALS